MSEKKGLRALQNGSDIRGIAIPGVSGEANLLRTEAESLTQGFLRWLSEKTEKPVEDLTVAVGCDSRLFVNRTPVGKNRDLRLEAGLVNFACEQVIEPRAQLGAVGRYNLRCEFCNLIADSVDCAYFLQQITNQRMSFLCPHLPQLY